VSRKYLGSYCAERDFIYNTRKLTDDERAYGEMGYRPGVIQFMRCIENERDSTKGDMVERSIVGSNPT